MYNSRVTMPKRTYQPKKRKRIKKHGFRKRMKSPGGINMIKRRLKKGRKRISIARKTK